MFESMKTPTTPHFGLIAEFPSAAAIFRACEKVRDAGFSRWDAHTPFPVHGLDRAMGIKKTILPWIVLVAALAGGTGGFMLQTWVHVWAYPLVISGKPLWSWPAFVPVTFELSVLGGAAGALFGMLHLCRLPRYYHPVFRSKQMQRATDDKFFISIEAADPRFDQTATAELMKTLGATHIEMVEH